MSANKRAALIGKLHTTLKKQYDVPPAQPTRPILEHVLYGSLLEDAQSELADEGMAKCEQDFFDWNEVRVTTVTELAQVLARLPEPMKAAHRLKSNLQAIFEEFYTFDIDHLKKDNLGKAISKFAKMPGMTPFVLNYTVQHGLGGHSIPVDYSAMVIMLSTGVVSQTEAMSGKVPGLERAIPKSKGIEFAGLLHQAAVALTEDIKDKRARTLLDSVTKGASDELDAWLASKKAAKKRAVKRKAAAKAAAEAAAIEAAKVPTPSQKKKKTSKKVPVPTKRPLPAKPGEKSPAANTDPVRKTGVKTPTPPRKAEKSPAKNVKPSKVSKPAKVSKTVAAKKATAKTKVVAKKTVPSKASKKVASKKKSVATSSTKNKTPSKKSPVKKPASKKSPAKKPASKKSAAKAKPTKKPAAKAKKSANRKLTKRKPR